jgi:hypothetical protein
LDQSHTTEATATIDTPLGTVRCPLLKTGDGAVTIEVTVPPHATATLCLPAPYRTWTESGLSLIRANAVSKKAVTLESGITA